MTRQARCSRSFLSCCRTCITTYNHKNFLLCGGFWGGSDLLSPKIRSQYGPSGLNSPSCPSRAKAQLANENVQGYQSKLCSLVPTVRSLVAGHTGATLVHLPVHEPSKVTSAKSLGRLQVPMNNNKLSLSAAFSFDFGQVSW